MILQALTRHYEDLLNIQSENSQSIPRFGYSSVSVSAIAQINKEGKLISIIPANADEPTKKRSFILPLQMKRSGSSPPPYFLSDNAQYVFGIEKEGVTEKSLNRFRMFKALHEQLLSGNTSLEATALRNFLTNWDPRSSENTRNVEEAKAFLFSGQIVFRVLDSMTYIHEIPTILEQWDHHYQSALSETNGVCLVTGERAPIARIHNSVKGIRTNSMQPNGWTLVGFDKDSTAFSSYGKIQGENAPVSEYAAFAYTAALNHLLADRNNVQLIGDTTVVCWAEGADPVYQDFAAILFGGAVPGLTDNDLRSALKRLANSLPCDDLGLDPDRPFYILGLAPNAARLSVRFFLRDTFGNLMRNVNDHYERLEIVRPSFAKPDVLPLWALLRETVNLNSKDKAPSPATAGATARAVFSGGPYPASLLEAVMLRIRAERDITWGRAAILKAYVMRNIIQQRKEDSVMKETANMELKELDENCTYMPYILGRLFCVMEKAQLASADWSINRTIKDSYFNAAASTPRNAFYKLFPLNEHHMKKLLRDKPGLGNKYSKLKTELTSKITAPIPARFTQEETICFYLGYYHQDATKKEETENG